MADETSDPSLLELATELTIAWLSNPNTRASADEVPVFLNTMHGAVTRLAAPQVPTEETPSAPEYVPAVSVRRSLASRDHLISLIDGKPYKTLKRHLGRHGLTPALYRERYGLKADYPMVAETYAEMRRGLAKKIGLGSKGNPRTAAAKAAAARPVAAASAAGVADKPAEKSSSRKSQARKTSAQKSSGRSAAKSPAKPAAMPSAKPAAKSPQQSSATSPMEPPAKPIAKLAADSPRLPTATSPAEPAAKSRAKLAPRYARQSTAISPAEPVVKSPVAAAPAVEPAAKSPVAATPAVEPAAKSPVKTARKARAGRPGKTEGPAEAAPQS